MREILAERAACPLYTAIAVIGGRWKPMLFRRLSEGPLGFGALERRLPGISRKVLVEHLRQLEADGLIVRLEQHDSLGSVHYRVSDYGATLAPVMEALWRWGVLHLARPDAQNGTRVYPPRSIAKAAEK